MNPSREEALFALALEKPAEKRPAFLDAVCEGDAALRVRLEALLAAHDQPETLLATRADAARPTIKLDLKDAQDEAVGQTLGRYKLLERVGEGGCGVVYVAEQTHPVRRRVALKVIKLGMDTKQVVARFEAERQALAMMDHPNIAKVLDAGTTDVGRPFFVMELVRGIRITDYCDQANLSTNERLNLFISVCHAIQHAHQKGIIHRDIKPSNILVTLHDGVPVPKVIDFGIAKATEGRLTDNTVYTQLHQFIGTPAYMSPEQAEMSGLDIDTRSDIYSLGVLLYELLAGSTPFDGQELMASGIDQMRKTIREKEPVRPSTRFATLQGDDLTTTARRRSADSAKLMHQLKGDLDWIVMKCLEKDRTRRYDTANGLAFDLKRHLNNEPVLARPASAAYKLRKAFRRNKLAFTAGTAVAAVLVLGVIGTTIGLLRAKRAESLALQSRTDAEELSNFMLDDFYAELQPSGRFETVAKLARKAVAYYDGLPASLRTPETERNRAMARARLALVTAQQGDIQSATPIAEQTAAQLEQMRQRGDQSEGTVYALALALEAESICHEVAVEMRDQALPHQRAVDALRPIANSAQGSRRTKLEYAHLLVRLSGKQRHEQGLANCDEALRILAGLGALDRSDLDAASMWAGVADSQAQIFLGLGRIEDAERVAREVEKVALCVLERRPGDLRAKQVLGYPADLLGLIAVIHSDETAALQSFQKSRRAYEDYVRFNPSDVNGWYSLAWADHSIAGLLYRAGRVDKALALDRATARVDDDHGNAGNGADSPWLAIARWEAQRGDRGAAEQALKEAKRSFEARATRTHMPDAVQAYFRETLWHTERQVKLALGENAAVLKQAGEALIRLEALGQRETHSEITGIFQQRKRQALSDATLAALKLDRFAEAEASARALIAMPLPHTAWAEWTFLHQPDDFGWAGLLLAQVQVAQGHPAEALKTIEPTLARYREMKVRGATHIGFHQRFARALYVQALAQSADTAGIAQRRESLVEAARTLNELSDEARQLHDTKELLGWVEAEQRIPNRALPQP